MNTNLLPILQLLKAEQRSTAAKKRSQGHQEVINAITSAQPLRGHYPGPRLIVRDINPDISSIVLAIIVIIIVIIIAITIRSITDVGFSRELCAGVSDH